MLSSFESRIAQLMIYMKARGCCCSHGCESMTKYHGLYATHRFQGHPIDVLTHDVM